ncbi:L-idonate 5-dehydrogenase [Arthrobacter sp. V4I6]|uniref:L-idonate 5-dehydrogenase n=1 Tax=unclassified Arthrobacter TaxID=235627 RepID=UPI0027800F24|nr:MULTISPECIES: L-idonate 5-dehydrogenase [unclassified Arthrobacter]MDQ0819352.1 L-idonate 5-dehydrogenase [Arthrobacter sp. V1I7]MDQ0853536.1 L-idonate 5-dehydrogenase [Arthrobacter sp. V4I6]
MKAVVVHGKGDLRVEERPDPLCPPDAVIVDIEYGGICGSDIHYVLHGATGLSKVKQPMILGHEVAGRIRTLGADVSGLREGEVVTIHPATTCGACTACLAGRSNLCGHVSYYGSAAHFPHTEGAFASQKVVAADQIRVAPPGVSTRHAAVAEPLAVAIHAVRRAGTLEGKTVLVNGAGPIGSLVIAAARLAGAAIIHASDVAESSLAVARAMGADTVVNARNEALPEADVAFEASGIPGVLGGVLSAVRRGGIVVQVGNLPAGPVSVELAALVSREIDYRGTYRFEDEISTALDYLADGLDVEPVLSHTFDADDAAEAFRTASDRGTGSSKVLLKF